MSALDRLHELVWSSAARVGRSAPKIADDMIRTVCPDTFAASQTEGVSNWLRLGLIAEVKRILKAANDDSAQQDFSKIDPAFHSAVRELKSHAYFVESLGEQVPVPDLIKQPELLDQARAFMRQKGQECLDEARRLDQLYRAVTDRPAA